MGYNRNNISQLNENIDTKIKKIVINLDSGTGGILTSYNEETQRFEAIKIDGSSEFRTGEKIFYQPQGNSTVGLETGSYFVEVTSENDNDILSVDVDVDKEEDSDKEDDSDKEEDEELEELEYDK